MTVSQLPLVIATHSGSWHADDVFGVCVLRSIFSDSVVIRTRDNALIEKANFAVDVGGVWDEKSGRFDHHQRGFSQARADGTVYASAGLVWSAHGVDYVLMCCPVLTPAQAAQVAQQVDAELVVHLDRADTGASIGAPGLFGLSALVSQLNTTWREEEGLSAREMSDLRLERFLQAVDIVQVFLRRCVMHACANLLGAAHVRASKLMFGGQVLVINTPGLDWVGVVCDEMPDVRLVVYPDSTDNQFQIRTVPVAPQSFTARLDLPAPWAGLRGAELAAVCGASDAVFCHNARFIAGAGSLAGALHMAQRALEAAATYE